MRRAAMALAMSMLVSVLWIRPVHAEDPDGWSVVFTPQVWLSHISKNGFAAPPKLSTFGIGLGELDKLNIVDSRADSINPQAGAQIALQKGRWTIALAGQFTSFTTKNTSSLPERVTLFEVPGTCEVLEDCFITPRTLALYTGTFPAGTPLIRERLETDRADFDLAVSYFFPDAVKDILDLSLGFGLKYIYADATRTLTGSVSQTLSECGFTLSGGQVLVDFSTCRPTSFQGNSPTITAPGYLVCKKDDCSDITAKSTVKSRSFVYGATFPTSMVFHLSRDKRWLLPLNVSLFLGAETRDDHDVVYATTSDPFKVKRLDGTTFAYGVTSDISVRYLFEVGNVPMSAYAGMRVQAIKGHEQFLAYGPIIGMSVRFGK